MRNLNKLNANVLSEPLR